MFRNQTQLAIATPVLSLTLCLCGCTAELEAPAESYAADRSASACPVVRDRGITLARSKYDYAPSVMRDDDGRYRMWWCGQERHDVIFYAESADGQSWSSPRVVLRPASSRSIHACDPSVVKASNGQYYMFFTSEGSLAGAGQDNAIYLATSADGISWGHVNGGRPVITTQRYNNTYGIGQSSVVYADGAFIHFFTDTTKGGNGIYVGKSGDGLSFRLLNNGQPVLRGVTAVDAKYLPSSRGYLVAAEGPGQWSISFYLLDRSFKTRAHVRPKAGEIPAPCNHNPGLLGDARGAVIDESRIPVYFGSGTTTSNAQFGACWNPNTWDIRRVELEMSALRGGSCSNPSPPPGGKDCSACLLAGGFDPAAGCDAACRLIGKPGGHCGAPGSTEGGRCCACNETEQPPPPTPEPPAPPTPKDCSVCLEAGGFDPAAGCDAACRRIGKAGGRCAFPGSTNGGHCCACEETHAPDPPPPTPPTPPAPPTPPKDCSTCLQAGGFDPAAGCDAACRRIGKAGGHCAFPGSTDGGHCCACEEPKDCSTCLQAGGFEPWIGCDAACKKIGKAGGHCAFPGSTNRDQCCSCH